MLLFSLSKKMMPNFYVLGSRVEDWVLRYIYGACVVTFGGCTQETS